MKEKIKKEDSSVPYYHRGYYYYHRTEEKSNYQIYCRKRSKSDKYEEIILDANILAQNKKFFDLGQLSLSPNQKLLAYSTDTVGRRIYTIYFKQLNNEQALAFVLGLVMAVASGVLNYCLWSPYLVGLRGTMIVSTCCVYAGVFAFGLYAHSTVKNSNEMDKMVRNVFNQSNHFVSM